MECIWWPADVSPGVRAFLPTGEEIGVGNVNETKMLGIVGIDTPTVYVYGDPFTLAAWLNQKKCWPNKELAISESKPKEAVW
jgi:hypothetical protein